MFLQTETIHNKSFQKKNYLSAVFLKLLFCKHVVRPNFPQFCLQLSDVFSTPYNIDRLNSPCWREILGIINNRQSTFTQLDDRSSYSRIGRVLYDVVPFPKLNVVFQHYPGCRRVYHKCRCEVLQGKYQQLDKPYQWDSAVQFDQVILFDCRMLRPKWSFQSVQNSDQIAFS